MNVVIVTETKPRRVPLIIDTMENAINKYVSQGYVIETYEGAGMSWRRTEWDQGAKCVLLVWPDDKDQSIFLQTVAVKTWGAFEVVLYKMPKRAGLIDSANYWEVIEKELSFVDAVRSATEAPGRCVRRSGASSPFLSSYREVEIAREIIMKWTGSYDESLIVSSVEEKIMEDEE